MRILTCPAQLQRLEAALRSSLPRALPVYGAVLNINRGNPGDFEVVVDTWPDFGAVLARRRGEVARGDLGRLDLTQTLTLPASSHTYPQPRPIPIPPHRPVTTTPPCRLDPDVQLGALSPAHVELLDSTWPYGGNTWSRRYLRELLQRFPHLCLQGPAGDLLCWVLSDGFAAGAHGYTVPAQRRRGLMRALTSMAARRAHARGFPAYG
ncbi:GLYL3 protein, partial [Odontophorus gujanensis]|nr:GLYL3 protein [Odontophorus gujanensis]